MHRNPVAKSKPTAQEGGDSGRGGTQRAQVTIYGLLVTVVLSLWPAPSEKWYPLLNPGRVALGPSRLGQLAQRGRERLQKSHPASPRPPLLSTPLHRCPEPGKPPVSTHFSHRKRGEVQAAAKSEHPVTTMSSLTEHTVLSLQSTHLHYYTCAWVCVSV